jgi:hypothetical protein
MVIIKHEWGLIGIYILIIIIGFIGINVELTNVRCDLMVIINHY